MGGWETMASGVGVGGVLGMRAGRGTARSVRNVSRGGRDRVGLRMAMTRMRPRVARAAVPGDGGGDEMMSSSSSSSSSSSFPAEVEGGGGWDEGEEGAFSAGEFGPDLEHAVAGVHGRGGGGGGAGGA